MNQQQELVKRVKAGNRLSNGLLCLKIAFDLIPQVLCISMVGLYFSHMLTPQTIWVEGSVMVLCYGIKAICSYFSTWQAHRSAYGCMNDLRVRIIRHLKKLPLGFFQERKTGDLTNVVQHDVEQVEVYLAHGLPETMSATLLPALVFGMMLILDWRLALVMVAGLPLMWLTRRLAAPLWKKNTKIFSDSVRQMQENILEYVANISVIKAFGKEETKTEKTLQSAKNYDTWVKRAMRGISVPMGLIDIFMESGVVLVMILGTYLFSCGELSITRLMLAILLGGLFTSSIAKVATFHHYSIVFQQAMEGIGSILNVPLPDRPEESPAARNGDIVISDLDFTYDGEGNALENINLCFPEGSKNALVGASGCGKSTIANLLMGFWKPQKGTITVAGQDLETYSEKERNRLFSIVQQEVFLFHLSLEDNIRIGKPGATREEIVAAAKKARIHDVIQSLPDGYQTMAGEAGVKLSGGEKQRISLARMFLKDAPILILDEATAAVDPENEAYIQEAVDALSREKTVLMIAHHLRTIREVDQIVVIDSGKIIDTGTHGELLSRCDLYRTMVEDQERVDHWNIKEVSK